jgi:separase
MGCSSAELKEQGEYEPVGTVLSYLIAGSPCVLGNLWNVTDGDSAKFTKALLEQWLQGKSITDCMIVAREKCKLKFLNGAATVCYGIPAYIKQ